MNSIYNTPIEIGIRVLTIINDYKNDIDLDSIVFLDYLSLHANIVDSKLRSIHPDNPFHGLEILSKRKVIRKAINLLILKGLIEIKVTKEGIYYHSNSIGEYFLSFFDCKYFIELNRNINKIINLFINSRYNKLEEYVMKNLEDWYGEI